MSIATQINFVAAQARLALDETAQAEHRELAHQWTANGLGALPRLRSFRDVLAAASDN